jgi:hypothetical protein
LNAQLTIAIFSILCSEESCVLPDDVPIEGGVDPVFAGMALVERIDLTED